MSIARRRPNLPSSSGAAQPEIQTEDKRQSVHRVILPRTASRNIVTKRSSENLDWEIRCLRLAYAKLKPERIKMLRG